jgi:alkylation response protein AidB-like acyl-CoA dehydrogenase
MARQSSAKKTVVNQVKSFSMPSRDHFYPLLQLTDTRQELRETFEKFAQQECAPLAVEMDNTGIFPHHMWRKLGD